MTFLNARLRTHIPYRQDKLPWHEWILSLRAAKKPKPIRNLAQPLPLPALSHEQHAYVNDRNEDAIQVIPKTDAPLSGFLELARWRHDFPPPQNIVAEQLAAASAHQVVSKEKESLVWSPDSKKWESLGTHDCDWLLFDFLLNHDDCRAGPWQHAKAQLTLSNLFHVRHPMAAPKPISSAHDIPTSVSSRDLSNLRGDIPTCWQEPVKPFTVRFIDWDGGFRKMRIKPEPSKFTHVYHNPKFPLHPTPICDDRKHYFAKERMQREGVQSVQGNSVIELVSDALGGARFKPIEDPLEYLQSFIPEEVPLHSRAASPQARHEADKEKFAERAAELERLREDYERQAGKVKSRTQPETLKKLLVKHGLKGPELSGLKWRAPKSASSTCPSERETERTRFEEAVRDAADADVSIINVEDGDYLRRKAEYGEVFRRFYGNNPDQQFPLTRDLYLFETALSKDWKSAAEKKEWQRRIDRMYFFIHGVCPTGTCLNNRCANPKLSPNERLWTHATNLLQRVAPHKVAQLKVGIFHVVVMRQGQPRLELLKAKTAEQASIEFDRLVESKVTRARAEARGKNKSEKEAERSVRAAYQVADLLFVASERYPQSGTQDIAAD